MSKNAFTAIEDEEALPERVLLELEAAAIVPGRAVVVVDADEVLVHFADHFKDYCVAKGITFDLTEYRLDTALKHVDGTPLSREEINPLIWSFIETETASQPVIEGAAEALQNLSQDAQVIVLTNAPAKMRDDRIANLADHGMPYPVIMNEGGKGRALTWISERAAAPVAFVDDSVAQLGSAAKRAPQVMRFHLVAPAILKPIIGRAEGATVRAESWTELEPMIRKALADGL